MKTSAVTATRYIGVSLTLIAAFTLIAAWSLGVSALIRKEYDPAMPQWVVVSAVATAIVGVMMLIGRFLRTSTGQRFTQIFVACLVVPLVATVFGGIYLWVADRLFRGREPGMTFLLGAGLGATVFGFGIATKMEAIHMVQVFAGSLAGLIALRLSGRRDSIGMMRFGALHFVTFFAAMVVASIEDEQRQKDGRGKPPQQETNAEQDAAPNP